MAHSTLRLGDRRLLLNDSEILVTAFWMLRHAQAHPDEFPREDYPWLEDWEDLLEPYMAGAVSLGLHRNLTTPADIERFGALAQAARATLAAQPEMVPGDVLNAMFDAPDLFTYADRPRDTLLADFDRIAAFVAAGLD